MKAGRSLFLATLIFGLLIGGLMVRDGRVVALALPLAVYLLAGYLKAPEKPQLTAERSLSHEFVSPGAPVSIRLAVTNHGPDIPELQVADLLPPELELVEGETRIYTGLASGASLELAYTVRGRRGVYTYTNASLVVNEPLDILQYRALLPTVDQVLVKPMPLKLQPAALRPLRTHGYMGPIPARLGGSGINFLGVRDYQSGDPLHWINWKVAARHEQAIFTNEFEQERVTSVGLILDARQRTNVQIGDETLFEYSVQATAALADAFLNDGHQVSLLIYGRGQEAVFPGYGKTQHERILRCLARAHTGENMALENLGHLPTRFFPARSQIVLISPLIPEDLPVLVRLRSCGYSVLVISPDLVRFQASRLEKDRALEFAVRIASIERTLLIRNLRRMGVQVISWHIDEPLAYVMRKGLLHLPAGILRNIGASL